MKSLPKGSLFFIYTLALLLLFMFSLEIGLRKIYNFRTPELYISSPVYGYRLAPNQDVIKHTGKRVKTNNLAIRADNDWNENPKNKILFLGNSVTYGGAVSNNELFSTLVTSDIDSIQSGSAGVNGWGVRNICALVIDYKFLPADTYVTVVLETDFYRGLQRIGLYSDHWFSPPRSAIHRVTFFFLREMVVDAYLRRKILQKEKSELVREREITVKIAAQELKKLDVYLKDKGFKHYIFISPERSQVYENAPIDTLVNRFIKENDIPAHYMLDDVKQYRSTKNINFFKDEAHLLEWGHEVWAEVLKKYIIKNS